MSERIKVHGLPLWSRPQWLLGAFFLASGLLAWWQFRPAPEAIPPEIERGRLPDYVVARFTAIETDTTGKPSRRLVAEELRQYVDEDLSELDQPRMTLYPNDDETDAAPWRARARRGLVLAGGEEVRLEGAVELERDGSATRRATRVETELMRIWHARAFAETDRPVSVTSEADRLDSTGMRLWYDAPVRAQFDGRAHIFIAPEQDDTP
jgi:lipopolysaccharide export system protein LptC